MAGHDASVNIRVSLLTAQILEYWGVCHAKLARSKSRKAAVPLAYVPQVSGALQIIEPRTLSRPQVSLQHTHTFHAISIFGYLVLVYQYIRYLQLWYCADCAKAPASRKSSLQSIQSNLHDKAAATCLVQNVSVLSQRSAIPMCTWYLFIF